MSVGDDIVDALAAPLRDAGCRVATALGDLVPPAYWVAAEGFDGSEGTLAEPDVALVALWWVPTRGVPVGEAAAAFDAMADATEALAGTAVEPLSWRAAQLVTDPPATGPWIAYRAVVTVHIA